MNKLLDTSAMSFPDLAARGLAAHLQDAVINRIIDEQMDTFLVTLRAALEKHVRAITLGSLQQAHDVLGVTQELVVKIDVNMQEVPA